MKIYLDNCCYNRPFDDQKQIKIQLETLAVTEIQESIVQNKLELVTSFMNHYEVGNKTDEDQKRRIQKFFKTYRKVHIGIENADSLTELTEKIMSTGIKRKDATHLASAIFAKCDYFITVDERLLKYKTDEIKLVNPIKFLEQIGGELNDC